MATAAEIRELVGRADKMFEDAKAIYSLETPTDEQRNEAARLVTEAKSIQTRAEQLDEINRSAVARQKFTDHLDEEEAERKEREEKKGKGPDEQKGYSAERANEPGPEEFKSWGHFLWSVWNYSNGGFKDERLVIHRDEDGPDDGPEEAKNLSGNQGSTGGFLIPTQFEPNLMSVTPEEAIVRPRATIIRIQRRQVGIPVLDQTGTQAGLPHWFGGMVFYWKGEGDEKIQTEPQFRQVQLIAKKLIGLTHAGDELLDDSAIALGDFLSGPLGFRGGAIWIEDYSFLNGTGGAQPRGVINAPCTIAVARNTAGQINIPDVVTMVQNFLPSGKGMWVISQSAMANLIQMAGPAGNASYWWQPSGRDGVPGYLMGYPVQWSEKVPALGNRGDIGLFDFRYYLLGDRQMTTVESSKAPRWVFDETSWRMVHRVDGRPWLSRWLTYQDGTTTVSPFVVLGPTTSS